MISAQSRMNLDTVARNHRRGGQASRSSQAITQTRDARLGANPHAPLAEPRDGSNAAPPWLATKQVTTSTKPLAHRHYAGDPRGDRS